MGQKSQVIRKQGVTSVKRRILQFNLYLWSQNSFITAFKLANMDP